MQAGAIPRYNISFRNPMSAHFARGQRDRRHSDRPRNGDTRTCPKCGSASEFSERYRLAGTVIPAWLCDNPKCRAQDIVRIPKSPLKIESCELVRDSKNLRAKASRTLMRARARVEHAEKAIDQSDAKLRRRRKI